LEKINIGADNFAAVAQGRLDRNQALGKHGFSVNDIVDNYDEEMGGDGIDEDEDDEDYEDEDDDYYEGEGEYIGADENDV
jgi:hypothetical protein